MTANDFRLKILGNIKVLGETQIGRRPVLVPSHHSKNK